ncbi:UDP-2,4-diacetamido-2,4,6-trideoxy-beta-L-altropyranose hydrolase [uncultured Sunxiuqinia sp.]|uniref:UDP-2,4-diacetamido-2,4, 6-trideoxy-beta-L-altropyranose hydrolase n=1 Tax=uncultured Sunxiuqinia sp. TaxID=1573825 RepID=UPI0030D6D229
MKVLFRVSAGHHTGLGHLTRCIALAEAFSAHDIDSFFLIKSDDPHGLSQFLQNEEVIGLNYEFLPLACDKLTDVQRIKSHYEKGFSFLVLDHYEHDLSYQQQLKDSGIKWAQFDHQAKERILADIVINGNIAARKKDYRRLTNSETKLCIGYKFAIIRQSFSNQKSLLEKDRILIAMGGGTYSPEVLQSINLLVAFEDFQFDIVTCDEQVLNMVSNFANVTVHLNTVDVVSVYKKCEAAVVTGGVTTIELAVLNVPMIVIPVANNQVLNSIAWHESNMAISFSDIDSFNEYIKNCGLHCVINELKDKFRHRSISLDNNGRYRVAKVICELI